MTTKKKLSLRLKPKKPTVSNALQRLKVKKGSRTPEDFDENADAIVDARHKSEVAQKKATVDAETALAQTSRKQLEKKTYYDENKNEITSYKMRLLQDMVASFYDNFVCLTDSQIEDLESKLPKLINNIGVKVGSKAVYPPVLDKERKKLSRSRIVAKSNRLRYIESDVSRGLKMPEDLKKTAQYDKSRQAKKDLVKTLLALNYNDFEMCEYLEISYKQLAKLKKEVFFEEIAVQRQMSNEELFVQYKLQQMEVIKDLDVIIERFKGSKQLTALASAMKTKSDIYNEIIVKAYEFGVIEKTPEKQAVLVGNLDVSSASIAELKAELRKTNKQIKGVLSNDNFLTDDPIEVKAKPSGS